MAKHNFNEAESYVIQRWAISCELEQSLKSARRKYQELCERAVEQFAESHPEYYTKVKVKRRGGTLGHGAICVWKDNWPKRGKVPCGFWIENLRLEIIADEERRPPLSSIWIRSIEQYGDDALEEAKQQIATEAKKRLPAEALQKAAKDLPDAGYAVAYEFATKSEYLSALTDPDPDRFQQMLMEQLELLAKLQPILDRIFQEQSQRAK